MSTHDYIREEFSCGDVYFVQVGSNDGQRLDPLFSLAIDNPRWSGLLIEPLKPFFEQLRSNYRNQERFSFENMAVSGDFRGRKRFFFVSDAAKESLLDVPHWYDQLGSFDRNHIVKHLEGKLEPFIEEVEVNCGPLSWILDKHAVDHIDLLHIDAEGNDWEILSQFNFVRYKPRMIVFEFWHMLPAELSLAVRLLNENGYKLFESDLDIVAKYVPEHRRKHTHLGLDKPVRPFQDRVY